MRDDFRLMNDSQNKKMYVVNLSGEPPARGFVSHPPGDFNLSCVNDR